MIRATNKRPSTKHPAGDALGRLVITLGLTACMSGVVSAAALQATLVRGGNDAPLTLAEARAGRTRVAPITMAGQVLPLPEMPAGGAFMLAGLDRPASGPIAPDGEASSWADDGHAQAAAVNLPRRLARASGLGQPAAAWFAAPVEPEPVVEAERVVVQRGDTLLEILLRSGIERAEAHEVVGTLSTLYDPRHLRVGQAMAVEVERAGDKLAAPRLAALSLNLDFSNDLRVERDANGEFAARRVDRELVESVHAAQAVIDTNLYATARRHDVPDEALVNLANIFSWDVDFQRDLHPGDAFELVYEQVASPDGEVRGGNVLFASLSLRGRQVHAYRYEHSDGTAGYYDYDGRSLRKWLMRTPIDGARLSSGFGPRRHPILGYNRMHRGVDFAAPSGTPIYAAGDGLVRQAGRNGGYGNYIEIRHNDEFSTAYAHLSRFAKGLERGDRVKQGQIIGYVGSTGRSTGPHLHYEVMQKGEQINPMSIKPQNAARLVGAELQRFRRQIETINAARPTGDDTTTLAQR